MMKRKTIVIAGILALVATLAVTSVALAGGLMTSASDGGGKFASINVGGILGSANGHAVRFKLGFEGPAMPEPGFGGVSDGEVTVVDMDIVVEGTVGATYRGLIRCGERTSQTGISFWGMARTSFGGPWQYFAIAHDVSQDPGSPNPDNDRFLFILSNIGLNTDCLRFPDFFTYHPDEQPRGPAACDFIPDTNELNQDCRVWDPAVDSIDEEFPEGCETKPEFNEDGQFIEGSGDEECFVQRTLTAVWTGDEPFGCDGGLNKCSVTHRYGR